MYADEGLQKRTTSFESNNFGVSNADLLRTLVWLELDGHSTDGVSFDVEPTTESQRVMPSSTAVMYKRIFKKWPPADKCREVISWLQTELVESGKQLKTDHKATSVTARLNYDTLMIETSERGGVPYFYLRARQVFNLAFASEPPADGKTFRPMKFTRIELNCHFGSFWPMNEPVKPKSSTLTDKMSALSLQQQEMTEKKKKNNDNNDDDKDDPMEVEQ